MTYDAITGTIDFSEALVCLKRGAKVRRRSWPSAYIVLQEGKFNAYTVDEALRSKGHWIADEEDLLAMDWEECV